MAAYPRTVLEFRDWFADDAACRDYLVRLRWPEGFRCPKCRAADHWGHGAGLASLPGMRSADLGDGGDLVRGHASALASLGRSTVARDQSEKRDQRPGPAAGVGTGELSHGVEFAAQAASGNGSSRT